MLKTPTKMVLFFLLSMAPLSNAASNNSIGLITQSDPEVRQGSRHFTVMVPMSDGVSLATDIWLPKEGRGPWPTILRRTPYHRNVDNHEVQFVKDGFAVVIQDIRGKYSSEGVYDAFQSDGWGEQQDSTDTLDWITQQDFSNARVCLAGMSASGIAAYLGTGAQPSGLECTYSQVSTGDLYHIAIFQGGAYREELVTGWLATINALEIVDEIDKNPLFGPFWSSLYLPNVSEQIATPTYHRGGWFDPFLQGTIDAFTELQQNSQAKDAQRLVIGPWTHLGQANLSQGELEFLPNSAFDATGEELAFFSHHLKGEAFQENNQSQVRYYLMGDVADKTSPGNRWIEADTWPPESTETPFYFAPEGKLLPTAPGRTALSSFVYDPTDPVPTLGGQNLFNTPGPYDQRAIEDRSDVLIFTSEAQAEPLIIAGRLGATLWVASSAMDTDFTVKISDVYPDGRSMLVSDGILKMRSREGDDHEVFMEPGQIYEVDVDLWSTAIAISPGHKLRVAISSSNSPRFQPNTNSGEPFHQETEAFTAQQHIFHDVIHPSHIRLPLLDSSDL